MQKILFFLLLILVSVVGPVFAQGNLAGSVKNIKGDVSVKREGSVHPLQKGMKIYTEDLVMTGKTGAVGIILQDNTIFSLGPETQLTIKEFVFIPDQSKFSLLAKMIKGTFVYISGVIGKLAPESIQLETPAGTIAIRGTKFAAKIAGN
ncbi:MAG: FecR domain-containing protein [Desulfobulbaceae bacterium]|nr:FecR domain-containing protein [Desulfobulbaceae bacterium]